MFIQKRKIYAAEEDMDMEMEMDVPEEGGDVSVAPEATDLLFEAEDVAELVAEVTGEPVEVEVADDGESVTFAVGEDEFLVQAEGDEEVLEAVRRPLKGKKSVAAKKTVAAKPVKASKKPATKKPVAAKKAIRKVPRTK